MELFVVDRREGEGAAEERKDLSSHNNINTEDASWSADGSERGVPGVPLPIVMAGLARVTLEINRSGDIPFPIPALEEWQSSMGPDVESRAMRAQCMK